MLRAWRIAIRACRNKRRAWAKRQMQPKAVKPKKIKADPLVDRSLSRSYSAKGKKWLGIIGRYLLVALIIWALIVLALNLVSWSKNHAVGCHRSTTQLVTPTPSPSPSPIVTMPAKPTTPSTPMDWSWLITLVKVVAALAAIALFVWALVGMFVAFEMMFGKTRGVLFFVFFVVFVIMTILIGVDIVTPIRNTMMTSIVVCEALAVMIIIIEIVRFIRNSWWLHRPSRLRQDKKFVGIRLRFAGDFRFGTTDVAATESRSSWIKVMMLKFYRDGAGQLIKSERVFGLGKQPTQE